MKIHYTLTLNEPSEHLIEVELSFTDLPDKESLMVHMPVWRPGRYLIMDFAGDVQEFSAINNSGNHFKWKKTDKSTWQIFNEGKDVKIKYKVYAVDFNLRTKGFDEEHAFINPVSVFMFSEKYRTYPLSLKINDFQNWKISTGLEKTKNGFYTALNYDHFADCPLEIGKQHIYSFQYDSKTYEITINGYDSFDFERFEKDFIKIINVNLEFWGRYVYDRYLIIIHCNDKTKGGTEHLNSTVLDWSREAFDDPAMYKKFLRLVSHEFFHTWNVKQIKPKALTPINYLTENYLEELWIAEGGTSYYDGMMLLRTGHYDQNDIFEDISYMIKADKNRNGNMIQSLAESSFDAWIKFWKIKPQRLEAESDYYMKGSCVSLLLDLEIRNRTKNKHTLDNIYRHLFETYPVDKKGYTNQDFKDILEKLTGLDFHEFFDNYVYGLKPLNWDEYLSFAGLKIQCVTNDDDTIGYNLIKISDPDVLQINIYQDLFKLNWSDNNDS